ncbi:MAG: hypothetical protein Q9170_003082 [Blastenia crenularia]
MSKAGPIFDFHELTQALITKGPHKYEPCPRRVRGFFDNIFLFDTTAAYYVWEHPYYPHHYIPVSDVKPDAMVKENYLDDKKTVMQVKLKGLTKSTGPALLFEKGVLKGMIRVAFGDLDTWFEEDVPIYQHPKDPYKRIDILPSSRKITVKVGDVVVAESVLNMFLFETLLRTRYYMPKTAIQWQYTTPSSTSTICPYKGKAEYYNLSVNGKEIADAIWWYRYPTHESAPIAGLVCFYHEKVNLFIDDVREEVPVSEGILDRSKGSGGVLYTS